MTHCKLLSARNTILIFGLCSFLGLLASCASTQTHSKKTPGADLWNYQIYSWAQTLDLAQASAQSQTSNENMSPGTSASQISSSPEQIVRARVDRDLARKKMIHVSMSGNPDFWIFEQVTPGAVGLEFKDAHTGKTFWRGEAKLKRGERALSQDEINTSVDQLVGEYISAQNWMPWSFWWMGITFPESD